MPIKADGARMAELRSVMGVSDRDERQRRKLGAMQLGKPARWRRSEADGRREARTKTFRVTKSGHQGAPKPSPVPCRCPKRQRRQPN